jgi:hypothetical protein
MQVERLFAFHPNLAAEKVPLPPGRCKASMFLPLCATAELVIPFKKVPVISSGPVGNPSVGFPCGRIIDGRCPYLAHVIWTMAPTLSDAEAIADAAWENSSPQPTSRGTGVTAIDAGRARMLSQKRKPSCAAKSSPAFGRRRRSTRRNFPGCRRRKTTLASRSPRPARWSTSPAKGTSVTFVMRVIEQGSMNPSPPSPKAQASRCPTRSSSSGLMNPSPRPVRRPLKSRGTRNPAHNDR